MFRVNVVLFQQLWFSWRIPQVLQSVLCFSRCFKYFPVRKPLTREVKVKNLDEVFSLLCKVKSEFRIIHHKKWITILTFTYPPSCVHSSNYSNQINKNDILQNQIWMYHWVLLTNILNANFVYCQSCRRLHMFVDDLNKIVQVWAPSGQEQLSKIHGYLGNKYNEGGTKIWWIILWMVFLLHHWNKIKVRI